MNNQEFLDRAAITTAELASAGKLNPEQSNRFIDYVIDESVLKNMSRLVRFRPDQLDIDKIGVGNRVAVPKAEAVDPGVRRGVNTSKVSLLPKDIMVPFEISDTFQRFNIEGDDVEDHIIRMMATQLANDLDELWLNGNSLGPAVLESTILDGGSSTQYVKDSYLGLFDGFLKLAEAGHVVDGGNAALDGAVFNKAILAMPTKFRKNRNLIKFLLSPDHEQGYREEVSGRATPLGDNALQSVNNLSPFGVEMMPVPLLSANPQTVENSVANTDGTTATQLSFEPVSNIVIAPTTLASIPTTAFALATDYTEVLASGTWTRLAAPGGSIGSGATIKATYDSRGKMMLTNPNNLIVGIGMDIRIERDRNIYKSVNEFAITVSVCCQVENTDAMVLVKNIADPSL